jgi:hypothetical protein
MPWLPKAPGPAFLRGGNGGKTRAVFFLHCRHCRQALYNWHACRQLRRFALFLLDFAGATCKHQTTRWGREVLVNTAFTHALGPISA